MTPDVHIHFVDSPHAPEIYASSCTGFLINNGNISLTFESPRGDHSTGAVQINRVVVARVVLPIAGAQALALSLHDYLTQQGFSPTAAVTAGETAQ
jgi:hypothetical protein